MNQFVARVLMTHSVGIEPILHCFHRAGEVLFEEGKQFLWESESANFHKFVSMRKSNFLQTLGPGILFASTAIGVSHLVQSTRAGAFYGFSLLWAVLAANIFKFPFFEFGTRYANVMGKSIIDGYRGMSKGMLLLYFLITLGSMFFVSSAVGAVTAGFFDQLFSLRSIWGENSTVLVSLVLFLGSALILGLGKYSVLDSLIKIIGAVLAISTLCAFVLVLFHEPVDAGVYDTAFSFEIGKQDLPFIIALMGWMPTAVDLSAWNSLWTVERIKTSGFQPSLKASLLDFNLGYWISTILSICFLVMGAQLLYGNSDALPSAMHLFAAGIVDLYTKVIGNWSQIIIGTAACSIMFGTCIAIFDGYSRSLERCFILFYPPSEKDDSITHPIQKKKAPIYLLTLLVLAIGSLAIVLLAKKQLLVLVDVATTLSFLIAPVIAVANYRLVTSKNFPKEAQPKTFMKVLSFLGMAFLLIFSIIFIWSKWN